MSGRFLLFRLGERTLGIEVAKVGGVVEASRVTPMPLVPPWIEGLILVRGAVQPQIDLNSWLFGEVSPDSARSLLQLSTGGGPAVARVDRVLSLCQARMAPADGDARLLGVIQVDGREVPVVDPDAIALADAEPDAAAHLVGLSEVAEPVARTDGGDQVQSEQTLVVAAAGEVFALPVRRVLEVVDVTAVEALPLAPPELLGMMRLRDRLVPLVSMAVLLGAPAEPTTQAVIVELGEQLAALAVSRIVGLEPAGDLIDHPLLERWPGLIGCWMGACGAMVGLVHLDFLLEEGGHPDLPGFLAARSAAIPEAPPEPRRTMLTFRLGAQLCAVDADRVERVVPWSRPHNVPEGGRAMEGVVQIMGEVMPVLDLAGRLALDAVAPGAFLVVRLGAETLALAVGQPGRMAQVPLGAVHPFDGGSHAVGALAHIDGQLAWVLTLDALDRSGAEAA